MKGRLINVRLDEPRLARARQLRARGITLSAIVRDAIDQRYEQLVESASQRDIDAIMQGIYDANPDPPGLPARDYDVRNSHQARAAVRRKLTRKRK
jgi:hypothetical protein